MPASIRHLINGRDTVTVGANTSVLDAARLMASNHIGAVPVVSGDSLAGIFSERDVMCRVVAAGLDPSTTPVSTVMTSQLVTGHPGESPRACLERMQKAHVRHLLLLDDQKKLAGILSLRDLLAIELDDTTETLTFLSAYVS